MTNNQIVISALADIFETTPGEVDSGVKSKEQKGKEVELRQWFAYLHRAYFRTSFAVIAKYIDQDHSTMIYSFRKITGYVENYTKERVMNDVAKDKINKLVRERLGKKTDAQKTVCSYLERLREAENTIHRLIVDLELIVTEIK